MLLLCVVYSCSDEWKKKEEVTDDGLRRGTTYEILEGRGNFTIFLDAVNRVGYRDLLEGKGLSTLFVPDDAAFQAYFTKHHLQGLEDLKKEELEQLIGQHILKFAYRETELNNFQPQTGMEDLPGTNYRHLLVVRPPIQEIYNEKVRRTMKVYNNPKYLPVFTTNLFHSLGIKAAENYNYFYPDSPWNTEKGIAAANAQVVESQIPSDNGYIYIVDQVIEPLKTVYGCIEQDEDFTQIKNIYDRFLTFSYNKEASLKYASAGDSLYFMGVENSSAYPLANLADEWTSTVAVWETPMFAYSFNAFLPSNKALQKFFTEYWEEATANDDRYASLEDVDKLALYYLLENHISSSNPAFPEQITASLKNSWGYSYTFNPEEAVKRNICGNGVFIGIDEVEVPALFQSVSKPVFQSPAYKIYSYILAKSGLLPELANSATEFTLFIMSDQTLEDAGYKLVDPGTTLDKVNVQQNGKNMDAAACAAFIRKHLIASKLDESVLDAAETQWLQTENTGNYIQIGGGQVIEENGEVATVTWRYAGSGMWKWTTFDLDRFIMTKENWLQTAEKTMPYSYKTWFKDDGGGNVKEKIIKNSPYFITGTSNLEPFTDNRGVFFIGTSTWVQPNKNDVPDIPLTVTAESKKEMGKWLDKHAVTLEDNPTLSLIDFISCKNLDGKSFIIHSHDRVITIVSAVPTTDTPVLGTETEKDLGEYKLTITVKALGEPDRTAIAYGPHMATDCVFFIIRRPEDRFVYSE